MEVVVAKESDAKIIHDLAQVIWWHTYKNILSDDQIAFMLQDMYSLESILAQMKSGDQFLLLKNEEKFSGFASFSRTEEPETAKIHKLYIHPDLQGKGGGRFMISYISAIAIKQGFRSLELNVNRNNPSKDFYIKVGFSICNSVDINYYRFILNDYVLRKQLIG
jgi:ribosomal protein S18 acetylase RimI-like enzyme